MAVHVVVVTGGRSRPPPHATSGGGEQDSRPTRSRPYLMVPRKRTSRHTRCRGRLKSYRVTNRTDLTRLRLRPAFLVALPGLVYQKYLGKPGKLLLPFLVPPPCLIPNLRPTRPVTNATARPAMLFFCQTMCNMIVVIEVPGGCIKCDVQDGPEPNGADRRGGVMPESESERGSGGCEPWLRPNRATIGRKWHDDMITAG